MAGFLPHASADKSFLLRLLNAADNGHAPIAGGEQALWCAVILQALEDAVSRSSKSQDKFHQARALHWLTTPSADFLMVCDCAGYHPGKLRKQIKRALANRCKWRTSPEAQGKEPAARLPASQRKLRAKLAQPATVTAEIIPFASQLA
jgi:hypothetical protein